MNKQNTAFWNGIERRSRNSLLRTKIQKMLNSNHVYKLSHKLFLYFFLISCAYLSVCIHFIEEVDETHFNTKIKQVTEEDKFIFSPLRRFQYKTASVFVITCIFTSATIFIFIRELTVPLHLMIKSAKRMSLGHLEETVPVQSKDEIGQLGGLMNDMASNFQEVILYTNRINRSSKEEIESLNNHIHDKVFSADKKHLLLHLERLQHYCLQLSELTHSFTFYDVKLERGMAVNARDTSRPWDDYGVKNNA